MTRQTMAALLGTLCSITCADAERPDGNQVAANTFRDSGSSFSLSASRAAPATAAHELINAERPLLVKPDDHPLAPAMRWAVETLPKIESIRDYSATLVMRQRVDQKLCKRRAYFVKIRHQPFSIYTRGLGPAAIKGEEAIYVEGKNDGKMWAHAGGLGAMVPTLVLDPKSPLAMRELRYPMTEIGIANLVRHMISVAENECQHDECEVRYFTGGKINGRDCSWLQVVHPRQRSYFQFYVARIFVDDQLKIPVRFEAYRWPARSDGEPELMEEYSYLDLKLNNGFSDADFSVRNPGYHFR